MIAAELAATLHHKSDVVPETHNGPADRHRPGVVEEPLPAVGLEHAMRPCSSSVSVRISFVLLLDCDAGLGLVVFARDDGRDLDDV